MQEREDELMIENQKLKLENADLENRKQRERSSVQDVESRMKKYQDDLFKSREENTKLKAEISKSQQQNEYKIIDMEKEIKSLQKKYSDLEQENDKFRTFVKDKTKSHMSESEDYLQNTEARNKAHAKRVQRLLDYKIQNKEGEGDATDSTFGPTNTDDVTPADTPSRAMNPSTGDGAYIESSKRRFVRNYTIAEKENSEIEDEGEGSEGDRQVYGGFGENESDTTSVYNEEGNAYDERIVQSIERRVGGYEPVFCKLDTNQSEAPTFQTPQVKFRKFVDPPQEGENKEIGD